MALTAPLQTFDYYMTDFWTEYGDPRTAHYPMMGSFNIPLAIFLTYHFFVLYLGPRLMRNRKPLSLKSILIPYNLVLSLLNFYFFIRILFGSDFGARFADVELKPRNYEALAELGFPREEVDSHILHGYIYLLTKYIDMFDTVFFVLRKKQSQVTGLHVYHHSMVPTMGWIYARYNAYSVTAGFFAFLNTPIHTIMYAYYGLAAFGPHMQKYLWWKRYITQIQIAQFVLLFVHSVYFCFCQSGYPIFFTADALFQTTLYLFLFSRFYIKTYSKKKDIKKD